MSDLSQTEQLFPTSSLVVPPAKTSAWLENVLDWVEREVACSMNNAELLMRSEPNGWCGKMSLAVSPQTGEKILQQSLGDSPDTPQLFPTGDGKPVVFVSDRNVLQFGGCLTLKTSESHKDAEGSSLLQVLEPWHDGLLKYCLSPKAATGILRRANVRNRTLPFRLKAALQHLAGGGLTDIAQCIEARYGSRGDLETESFILENAEPIQNVIGTLSPGQHGSGASTINGQDAYNGQLVPIAVWCGSAQQNDVAAPLLNPSKGGFRSTDIDGATWVAHSGDRTVVRRLTPLECERLMGWPDGWTAHGIDDNGVLVEIATTQRYRVCGNGIVATVTEWIGSRLLSTTER